MNRAIYLLFFMLIFGHGMSQESDPLLKQHTIWTRLHLIKKTNNANSIGLLIENRQYLDQWRGHMFLGELSYQKSIDVKDKFGIHGTYLIFTTPHDPDISETKRKDELRFQQSWSHKWMSKNAQSVGTRLMIEERLFKRVTNGETQEEFWMKYLRARTRVKYSKSLARGIDLMVSDEFMFQLNRGSGELGFDQNRLDIVTRYRLNPTISFDLGYLNWYQKSTEVRYLRHAIRTALVVKW